MYRLRGLIITKAEIELIDPRSDMVETGKKGGSDAHSDSEYIIPLYPPPHLLFLILSLCLDLSSTQKCAQ